MKYEELYNDFKKMFPEDSDYFAEQEKKLGRNSLDLITVVFDSIVSPYLIKLADENPQKAKKAFNFVEEMLSYDTDYIASVAEVSVLEMVMTDEDGGMKKLGKFLGPKSRSAVEQMASYFNIQMD